GWDSNAGAITRFQDEVGGPLKGGDPGVHLAGIRDHAGADYAAVELAATTGWQAVPVHHIFGSDSQSARTPAIAQRMPEATYRINAKSAKDLDVADGDSLELTVDGEQVTFPVTIDSSLPNQIIGVPVGAHGIYGLRLPV